MKNKLPNYQLFKEYAELKKQEKDISQKILDLQEKIYLEMFDHDLENFETQDGLFKFSERKSWQYTENVKLLEAKLKAQKKFEEEADLAKCEITKQLRFTPKK